jgi:hypothetical protein
MPRPTEPAVGQVQVHFFAQLLLGADPNEIAHNQYSDHQFRIDGRSAGVAVTRDEVRAEICQIEILIDAAQESIRRDVTSSSKE